MKLQIRREFKIPVQQVTFHDFIDICFPNAEGYFCVFQKTKKINRNTFYSKEEMEQNVSNFFDKTWGMNCYVSYSSYFTRKRTYESKEIEYRLKNGETVYAEACNLLTKEVYRLKERKVKKLRTQSNIVKTYLLAQDLDFYQMGISFDTAVKIIARLVTEGKIICPTVLISTGQGIQLIWAVKPFKNIKNYTHDREWRQIQKTMFSIFKKAGLNPDKVVKNPAAVTRAAETINMKSQTIVHAFYMNAANLLLSDFLFFHNIDPLADRLVKPKSKPKSKNKPNKKTNNKKNNEENGELVSFVPDNKNTENWNEYSLNRNREEDIFIFVQTMNERNKQSHYIGMRNWLCLVLRFHSLVSSDGDKAYALERVKSLMGIMDMSDTSEEELLRRSLPAEEYYEKWQNGTWDSEKYVQGGLFYKNRTMLQLMKIEKDYEIQLKMKTIKARTHKYKAEAKKLKEAERTGKDSKIDEDIKAAIKESQNYDAFRKRVEKFGIEKQSEHTWEAFQERRAQLLEENEDNKSWQLQKALERHPELSQRKLAKHLGWSLPTVQKYLKIIGKN
ncbi:MULTISPECIES: winged helix-turn-helix domain-containing protein [unclassified Bacillus cereus group]|nr:winged helix-turn-helix domain-containing protein [Bacillus cereus group sp. BY2-1LC]MDA1824072.1 winged helix-turn-helix domain-containing protein [Bacillus cereus group sp. BY2-1LC]